MSNLLGAELNKIWGNRVFKYAVFFAFVLNILFLWFFNRPSENSIDSSAYRAMTSDLAGLSMVEKEEFLEEAKERAEGIKVISSIFVSETLEDSQYTEAMREKNKEIFHLYYDDYVEGRYLKYAPDIYEECSFLNNILDEFHQVRTYAEFIQSVKTRAENITSVSIFQDENAAYNRENVVAEAEKYSELESIEVDYFPQKGIKTALEFRLTDLWLVALLFFLASSIVTIENEYNLWILIMSSPRGKVQAVIAKIVVTLLSIIILVLLFYGGNLIFGALNYGIGGFWQPIQSVPFMMAVPLNVSVIGYVVLYCLSKIGTFFIIGLVILLVTFLSRNAFAGYLSTVGILGFSFFLRWVIPATGILGILKYATPASFLHANELLASYYNLNIFGRPVERIVCEFIAMAVYIFSLILIIIICFRNGRKPSFHTRKNLFLFARIKRNRISIGYSIERAEAYKLYIVNGAAFVLLLYAVISVGSGVNKNQPFNPNEIHYRSYLTTLSGSYTSEKRDWLIEKADKFAPLDELQQALDIGRISESQYDQLMIRYQDLYHERLIFNQISGYMGYIANNSGAYAIYDTGYNLLFDMDDQQDIKDVLSTGIVILLCISDYIAKEKTTGLFELTKKTPLGRLKTCRVKINNATLISGVTAIISLIPRFWRVIHDFGLIGIMYPARSLTYLQWIPRCVPILFVLVFAIFVRMFALICISHIVLSLSAKTGKMLSTLTLSTILFVIFPVIAIVFIPDFKWLSIYPLFHAGAIIGNEGNAITLLVYILMFGIYASIARRHLKHVYTDELKGQ